MSDPAYTVVTEPFTGQGIRIVGTANQIVLGRRVIRQSQFGKETTEVWGATDITSAKAFQLDCLADERCSDCELEQNPPSFTLTARWAFDRTDSSWLPGQYTEETWELDFPESQQLLATHPYFTNSSGAWPTEVEQANYALATGEKPALGSFPTQMGRYVGLRQNGVDYWNPYNVVLIHKLRMYKSQVNSTWQNFYANVGRAHLQADLPTLPAEIIAALAGLKYPTYGAGGAVDPSGITAASIFWIKKPPSFQMVGRNPKGPRDITETFLGAGKVSAVLYPAKIGSTAAAMGLWDPIYTP
jgi:hypothetical protein